MKEKDIQLVAKGCDLSERAVQRLLGSVRVPRGGGGEEAPASAELGRDIGLRVDKQFQQSIGPEIVKSMVAALQEYKRCCPVVVSWLARGDFRAKEVPALVTPAVLLHASRTAGRLRAALMRGRTEVSAEQAGEEVEH